LGREGLITSSKLKNLLFPYKEKDVEVDEKELIDFDDFDKAKLVKASITKMSIYNKNISPGYIEESINESDPDDEDNFESPISLENCSNNIKNKRWMHS